MATLDEILKLNTISQVSNSKKSDAVVKKTNFKS